MALRGLLVRFETDWALGLGLLPDLFPILSTFTTKPKLNLCLTRWLFVMLIETARLAEIVIVNLSYIMKSYVYVIVSGVVMSVKDAHSYDHK